MQSPFNPSDQRVLLTEAKALGIEVKDQSKRHGSIDQALLKVVRKKLEDEANIRGALTLRAKEDPEVKLAQVKVARLPKLQEMWNDSEKRRQDSETQKTSRASRIVDDSSTRRPFLPRQSLQMPAPHLANNNPPYIATRSQVLGVPSMPLISPSVSSIPAPPSQGLGDKSDLEELGIEEGFSEDVEPPNITGSLLSPIGTNSLPVSPIPDAADSKKTRRLDPRIALKPLTFGAKQLPPLKTGWQDYSLIALGVILFAASFFRLHIESVVGFSFVGHLFSTIPAEQLWWNAVPFLVGPAFLLFILTVFGKYETSEHRREIRANIFRSLCLIMAMVPTAIYITWGLGFIHMPDTLPFLNQYPWILFGIRALSRGFYDPILTGDHIRYLLSAVIVSALASFLRPRNPLLGVERYGAPLAFLLFLFLMTWIWSGLGIVYVWLFMIAHHLTLGIVNHIFGHDPANNFGGGFSIPPSPSVFSGPKVDEDFSHLLGGIPTPQAETMESPRRMGKFPSVNLKLPFKLGK